ncbi:hypothetical protein M7I_7554 [Glarea lozoyensis 74030]|uniref:Xaa-Pro dipeptidyl-peptidase C-terminal domain-containing protein n=1 Tax=Glarea lozoyensis (strain ATCC 74030 / MF5533) TaxID=1104152 RepID=H0EXL7_GLAL7|nr:hypothetical protein M7I_7554 [Glarea lozoyensis 74030]
MATSNSLQDLHEVHKDHQNKLIFEKNVDIPRAKNLPIRCNVYRPVAEADAKFPVLVTYGPYGKDIPYSDFHPKSFAEVNPEHKSKYSVWETPDPVFWTAHGYVVVRADERGLGQSPGILDTMSRGTSECFFDVVEWAAEQPWSSGKVGLLGISYYAVTNQYGRPGRAASKWGEDTAEGDLPAEQLKSNRRDQNEDNQANYFRDDEYYASKDFNLADIEVPLLSVANWGGILLHLRGNVEGFVQAGSKLKYLRFIVGRHDLPFYYHDEVEVQRSFLDAFLKGEDRTGWSKPGATAPVSVVSRKGNVGFNNPEFEATYERREETAWPIANTEYIKYFLSADGALSTESKSVTSSISYPALDNLETPHSLQFSTSPFETEVEITGHIVAHLNVSMTPETERGPDKDIDLFVTLRYISPSGEEVHYTGTAGDPIPLTKGWLRVSHRKVDKSHPLHRPYLPYRTYFSTDVQPVAPGQIYDVDVEVWPTNVIVEKGGRLVFEVASGDTQGSGMFQHTNEVDR